ncbi:MAG: hypothetical protein ACK5V3_09655, partial [Bdellovibrionales bacterium]
MNLVMRSVLALVVILVSVLGWAQGTSLTQTQNQISVQKFKSKAMKDSRLKHQKFAQLTRTETLSQSALGTPRLDQEDGIFSGILNASYSRSLVNQVNGTLQSSQALLLIMNTKLSADWTLSNRVSMSQDLRNEESLDDGFSDLLFILLRRPNELNGWLLGSPIFIGVLPTAERSTTVHNLQTSISAGYNFIINPEV